MKPKISQNDNKEAQNDNRDTMVPAEIEANNKPKGKRGRPRKKIDAEAGGHKNKTFRQAWIDENGEMTDFAIQKMHKFWTVKCG